MRKTEGVRGILVSLAGLVALLIGLLILLPAEQTLGGVIKVVFLHGAILEVSLMVFAVAGLLGLVSLIWKRQSLYEWLLALQKTGLLMWVLSVVMSMVATYLAWGVVIAWEEPRVQASAKILGVGGVFFLLTQWVDDERFGAAVNIVMAVAAWWLTEGAGALRHPLNPIGSSESLVFKGLYGGMLVTVVVIALQVVRWFHKIQEGA